MSISRGQRVALEAGMTETLGRPVRLGRAWPLRPGRVYRVRLRPGGYESFAATVPSTVIAKVVAPRHRTPTARRQFANEVAALGVLPGFDAEVSPRLLAADPAALALAMEDLVGLPSLSDVLTGRDRHRAGSALVGFARLIGRLHRSSAGRSGDFYRALDAFGPVDHALDNYFLRRQEIRGCLGEVDVLAVALDLPRPGQEVADEWSAVMAMLGDPGDCLTFTTGDPCPDNVLVDGASVRMIDFEVAAFRHALLDVAYFVLPFPNCWCWRRVPTAVTTEMLDVYRAEISAVMPSMASDRSFAEALVRCCAAWLVFHLATRLPWICDANRQLDLFNERERVVAMLRWFVERPPSAGACPATTAWFGRLVAALERNWPREAGPIPLFPAFYR